MKKLCFSAVTMLLALVLFSCDGLIAPVTETGETGAVSADGTPLVELSVGVPEEVGRSLTEPLAKAGVIYYEVVFIKGRADNSNPIVETITEIYRTSWTNTSRSKIAIPIGTYNNTITGGADFAKAYMFAGRADGTLLALGVLDDPVVDATTKTVDFKLVPLLTDVNDQTDSTFQFTTAATTRALTIDGTSYTAFLQGPDVDDSGATYKIGITTTAPSPANDPMIAVFKDALRLAPTSAGTGLLKIDSKGWFDAALITNKGLPSLSGSEFSNLSQDATAKKFVDFSTDGTDTMLYVDLKMNIDTGTETGYALMWFDVPVFLATELYQNGGDITSPTTAAPFIWYLRGGVRNDSADAGITINGGTGSTGGAVVIGVFPANEANGIDVGGSVVTTP